MTLMLDAFMVVVVDTALEMGNGRAVAALMVDDQEMVTMLIMHHSEETDRYYVAYMPITLLCISFIFIEIKFIHCH